MNIIQKCFSRTRKVLFLAGILFLSLGTTEIGQAYLDIKTGYRLFHKSITLKT